MPPLYLQAKLAAAAGAAKNTELFLGGQGAADLLLADAIVALGVRVHLATVDGSRGHRGLVTAPLEQRLNELPVDATLLACGPTPMMRRCAEIAAARGRPCIASLENQMACGFGVCLGCAVPLAAGGFALLCRDGPMLDADAVAWEALP